MFTMQLDYNKSENRPQFNGNIGTMTWQSVHFAILKQYDFSYDGASRLKAALFTDGNKYTTNYSYDKNGNFKRISRMGEMSDAGTFNMIDDLHMGYTGNQLKFVGDEPGDNYQNNGFTDNGSFLTTNEYFYDLNGNLTSDLNKQIDTIGYNYLNLPQHIEMAAKAFNTIDYIYTANGVKLQKSIAGSGDRSSSTDYLGSIVYTSEKTVYILTPEGRALRNDKGSFDYEYFLKDHLGNTRVSFNQKGTILQDNSYYPFGMDLGESLTYVDNTATENKYKYNGKEMQDDFGLGWYDYGARFYDAQLGRFTTLDPLAESYSFQSPFVYADNNPIRFIDYLGMNADGYTIDENAKINRVDDTGGKDHDVLYTEEAYNAARIDTKENGSLKNEYGNPEPANSVIVSKGTFDASNIVTSIDGVKGLKVDNQTDAQAIFKFAADNFAVEYGIVTGDDGNTQSIIHTSGSFEYSQTGDVANYMIENGFFMLETNHSHPGDTPGGRTPSGFYSDGTPIKPLDGDAESAGWIDKENGSPATHLMYHPQSGKTYQYNNQIYVEKK